MSHNPDPERTIKWCFRSPGHTWCLINTNHICWCCCQDNPLPFWLRSPLLMFYKRLINDRARDGRTRNAVRENDPLPRDVQTRGMKPCVVFQRSSETVFYRRLHSLLVTARKTSVRKWGRALKQKYFSSLTWSLWITNNMISFRCLEVMQIIQ